MVLGARIRVWEVEDDGLLRGSRPRMRDQDRGIYRARTEEEAAERRQRRVAEAPSMAPLERQESCVAS